ncbi:MAG: transposase [Kosmotogaceae bacterium]
MDKFQNKYRIPSARAPFWDYGWNAAYFVTICIRGRKCFFGDVVDGRMELSAIGHIANSCWFEIPNHFPFVELGAHVVMPNHVHGIVIINKPDNGDNVERTGGGAVETQNFASLSPETPLSPDSSKSKNQFGPQSQNMASIIRGFKIGVTKNARLVNPDFAWQSRYHDHIIRNQISYQNISEYIINNPLKWDDDQFNPDKNDGNK